LYATILALSLFQTPADEIETLNRNLAIAQDYQDEDLQNYLEQEVPENKICRIETSNNAAPSIVCMVSYELI